MGRAGAGAGAGLRLRACVRACDDYAGMDAYAATDAYAAMDAYAATDTYAATDASAEFTISSSIRGVSASDAASSASWTLYLRSITPVTWSTATES